MPYFNFPKTALFSWKLENYRIYCLQQLIQIQEHDEHEHEQNDRGFEPCSSDIILEILENVSQDLYGSYLRL